MTGDKPRHVAFLDRFRSRSGGPPAGRRERAPWLRFLVVAFVTTYLALRLAPYLSAPEFGVLNAWFRGRPARPPDPRIVLIGIEKDDIEAFDQDRPHACTCGARPRDELGRLLTRLKASGAAVVAVDLYFDHTCPLGAATAQGHDAVLRRALKWPGENILIAAARPGPDRTYFTEPPPEVVGDANPIVASPVLHRPRGTICGVDLVQSGVLTKRGLSGLQPLIPVAAVYPAFSLAAYSAYMGVPRDIPRATRENTVRCASLDIPVWPVDDIYLLSPVPGKPGDVEGRHVLLTNWVGPIGTFPMYSYMDTVRASDAELAERFRDKVVVLGSLADRLHTPLSQTVVHAPPPYVDQGDERAMSGSEIHANCMDTIMQRRFINTLSRPWASVLVLLCALLAAAAFRNLRLMHAVVVVVAQVLALVFAARLLIAHDFWLYSFIPSLAVVSTGTFSAIVCYSHARQQAADLTRHVEAQEEATSTIVHDLKQPLAAISALAQVLRAQQAQQGQGASVSPELLALIEREVKLAVGDIDELLHVSSDRPLSLQKQEFDILSLIRDLAVAQSMISSIHEVEVRAPEGEVRINGDARLVARALSNLMDNAIKYWPDGGTVVIEVTAGPRDVAIKVMDGGLGINPRQQARVFDRYERALPEGVNIAGIGIGLYSVKHIIEAHLGTVTVDSELGKGSTFTVTLPYG